jgi:hypothetical protein
MADLVFLDSTNLSVGPTSEVRLDKFVYDPRDGSVVVQATCGAFRWVTGTQAKRAYQINTPYGTLGVRGTTVEFLVGEKRRPECAAGSAASRRAAGCEEECVTRIRLVEGEAEYKIAKTGKVARLTQPGTVACITAAGDVKYSTSSQSILSFSADASPPPPTFIPGTGGGTNPVTPPPVVSGTTPL